MKHPNTQLDIYFGAQRRILFFRDFKSDQHVKVVLGTMAVEAI